MLMRLAYFGKLYLVKTLASEIENRAEEFKVIKECVSLQLASVRNDPSG
jgi:hypothetical protein